MEVRMCRRCRKNFLWDSGPIHRLNSCPNCSGEAVTPDTVLAVCALGGLLCVGVAAAAASIWFFVKAIFE